MDGIRPESIRLLAEVDGRRVRITGGSQPPCCDFFAYEIDAVAFLSPRGDYDFNDLTVAYQVRYGLNGDGAVVTLRGTAYLITRGAGYSHDWKLRIPLPGDATAVLTCTTFLDPGDEYSLQDCSPAGGGFTTGSLDIQVFSATADIFPDPGGAAFTNTLRDQSYVRGPKSVFRVDLDAPLRHYVPGFRQPEVLVAFDAVSGAAETRPAVRDATIRELLSHTGGYGYWWLHEPLHIASGATPDLIDPLFLVHEPGSAFAYGTGTDVVGEIVRPVSGLSLDDFFRRRIFEPLGMTDTAFSLPADLSRLTHVHRRSGDAFRTLALEAGDNEVRGGSGLFSTAPDYARLVRCLLRGGELDGVRLLSPDAVAEIGRNQIGEFGASMQRTAVSDRSNDFIFMDGSQKFGFGVMVETVQQPGKRPVGSFGWGGIVNTFFWVDTASDLAAVLMMQLAPFANRASIELLDAFERAVYRDFSEGKQ